MRFALAEFAQMEIGETEPTLGQCHNAGVVDVLVAGRQLGIAKSGRERSWRESPSTSSVMGIRFQISLTC
jgi:hypothetical protein